MVIYIDVLLTINLYINFLLTKSASLILRRKISAKRCVLAAVVGALGSLIILLPTLPFFVVVIFKIALGVLITFVAFGKQSPTEFAVCGLFFLVISFTFGGLMTALWTFVAPAGMIYENGTAYFKIPIAALVGIAGVGYLVTKAVRRFSDNRLHCSELCEVKITLGNSSVTLSGLRDTGCGIYDLFSGKPVVICKYEKIFPILPQNIIDYYNGTIENGIRLVPCKTVADETLIPIFTADNFTIDGKSSDALIGVTKTPLGDGIDCVFNPKIISI